jgi:hypothetical protein
MFRNFLDRLLKSPFASQWTGGDKGVGERQSAPLPKHARFEEHAFSNKAGSGHISSMCRAAMMAGLYRLS